MTEIFINNQSLDLSDADIVLSFGINNLFDIQSTNGAYSNTFRIPATNKNNLILGGLNNVLSISQLPYVSQVCQVYVNGLLQLVGLAQIQSATRFEYEILIVAGNGNWISKLQDKNLQDLLTGCNHTQYWNVATVSSSRSNLWNDIYNYANVDYGDVFFFPPLPHDVNWYNLYPAIYCKYLFKKIFSDIGYNIDSDWFDNNALFEKQIIPWSAFWVRNKEYDLRNYCLYTLGTDVIQNAAGFIPINLHTNVGHTLETPCFNFRLGDTITIPATPFFLNPIRQIAETICTLDGCTLTINFNITYETDTLASCAGTTTQIICDYVDVNGNTQLFNFFTVVSGCQPITNITGTIIRTDVGRGGIRISMQQCKLYAGSTFEFSMEANDTDEDELEINFAYNFVTLGSTLPSMAVTDFIKTIANQYGLLFQQSENTNTIRIFQFKDIIRNLPTPTDWSDKLDLSEEPIITFDTDAFARNNYFQYSPDSADEYLTRVPDLGRGTLTVQQSNLPAETILFEGVFSPVLRKFSFNGASGIGGTVPMAYIPAFEGDGFNNVNARMAYIEFDTSALVTISGQPLISPQPNVYFDELDFKKLLPLYYPIFEQILNNLKQVNCLIRLNTMDINNIDFSKPIWIDYFGAYFYLNLIEQYNITNPQSTNVNLILLNQ